MVKVEQGKGSRGSLIGRRDKTNGSGLDIQGTRVEGEGDERK